MKLPPTFPKKAALAAVAAALTALAILPGCGKGAKPAARPSSKSAAGAAGGGTNTAAGSSVRLATEFVSVFDGSPPPGNKGRDPFNPNSQYRVPTLPPPLQGETGTLAGPQDPQLRLYGVAGSPKRWLATINNYTFEAKEEATVTVPGGKVNLRVIEIGSNYADVMIEATGITKRLTLSQGR